MNGSVRARLVAGLLRKWVFHAADKTNCRLHYVYSRLSLRSSVCNLVSQWEMCPPPKSAVSSCENLGCSTVPIRSQKAEAICQRIESVLAGCPVQTVPISGVAISAVYHKGETPRQRPSRLVVNVANLASEEREDKRVSILAGSLSKKVRVAISTYRVLEWINKNLLRLCFRLFPSNCSCFSAVLFWICPLCSPRI